MHPLREQECDKLFDSIQATRRGPPTDMVLLPKPKYKPCPPRFVLLPVWWYHMWCAHRRQLQIETARIDSKPPPLFPELYLKPRRLNAYAFQLEENMLVNKDLLKRINMIQKKGGFVDCWRKNNKTTQRMNEFKCKSRQKALNSIRRANFKLYMRLLHARSDQLLTKELDEEWKKTKVKLILGATLPFILFKTEQIDRGIKDPDLAKPEDVQRKKVVLDIWVKGGSKIGKVTVELFNDIVPQTCHFFMSLVKGEPETGHAYAGTKFYRIVPNLFCLGGDVTDNNGYGQYISESKPLKPENYTLKHTVPGILSMPVSPDNEMYGHFNIVFKPLPQFDEKNVVFGRIIAGPAQTLERISALGLPLGTPAAEVIIKYAGYYTRSGVYKEGMRSRIKFEKRQSLNGNQVIG